MNVGFTGKIIYKCLKMMDFSLPRRIHVTFDCQGVSTCLNHHFHNQSLHCDFFGGGTRESTGGAASHSDGESAANLRRADVSGATDLETFPASTWTVEPLGTPGNPWEIDDFRLPGFYAVARFLPSLVLMDQVVISPKCSLENGTPSDSTRKCTYE